MLETGKLSFTDVKKKIAEHLKTALGVEEFTIIFARQEADMWRVNIEYKEKTSGDSEFTNNALFTIDVRTGEVKEFGKGRLWRF